MALYFPENFQKISPKSKKVCFPAFLVFFSGASRQILPKRTLSSPKSPGLELSGGVEFPRGVGFPGGSSFPENDCDLKMA